MWTRNKPLDKWLLASFLSLIIPGFFVFLSASYGILAKNAGKFSSMTFNHIFFGLFLGIIACVIFSKIDHKILRKYSFLIFVLSVGLSLLVFVPGIGLELKGANRWIVIFGTSVQPVEFLKIGFLIYWASYLSYIKEKVATIKFGVIPFLVLISVIGILLGLQPDIDSFAIIAITALIMFLVAGAKWKHVITLVLIGVVALGSLTYFYDHARERVMTFVNQAKDLQGAGYQVNQSILAIGSGQLFGRGYGVGIQKFKYLPETLGDSIFAVIGEELGFVGSVIIIIFFLLFMYRGLRVSRMATDNFGGLLALGIVILIIVQSFMNIASMLGLMPLAGTQMIFFSHGGTAMMSALIMVGILFNISRYKKTFKTEHI